LAVEEPVVESLLARIPPGPALDAACGTGRHTVYARQSRARSDRRGPVAGDAGTGRRQGAASTIPGRGFSKPADRRCLR
jgi:hypothetical protein